MKESFARSADGLSLHFLDSANFDPSLTPLVIVPGMMGVASHFPEAHAWFGSRRVVVLTHRGLGKSQAIRAGQGSFFQRAGDIAAVTGQLGLENYHLYGFSRGVSLAVQHALENPAKAVSLILHDCEPTYPKITEKWRDQLIEAKRSHIPEETVRAYWQDSEAIDLTPRLGELTIPTLILRGAKEGSLLPETKAEAMAAMLPRSELVCLPNSAHEPSEEDKPLFVSVMSRWMYQAPAEQAAFRAGLEA